MNFEFAYFVVFVILSGWCLVDVFLKLIRGEFKS